MNVRIHAFIRCKTKRRNDETMKTNDELRDMITSNTYVFDIDCSRVMSIQSCIINNQFVSMIYVETTINAQSIVDSYMYEQCDDKLTCVHTTNDDETTHDINSHLRRANVVRNRAIKCNMYCEMFNANHDMSFDSFDRISIENMLLNDVRTFDYAQIEQIKNAIVDSNNALYFIDVLNQMHENARNA